VEEGGTPYDPKAPLPPKLALKIITPDGGAGVGLVPVLVSVPLPHPAATSAMTENTTVANNRF